MAHAKPRNESQPPGPSPYTGLISENPRAPRRGEDVQIAMISAVLFVAAAGPHHHADEDG